MRNKKIDTVLFDFDGTVMNTNEVIINSWQHTFRTIEGRERPVSEIVKTFGEPLAVTMEKFFPHTPVDEAINIYRNYHYEKFGDLITLFPGMKELIQKLKEQRYRLALVTSRLRGTTMQGLEKYGLDQLFEEVVTMEDCTKHKPDPEPINIALERLSAKPENSLMLGDTLFDIRCARNAGVKSVLVSWALAVGAEELNGPDAPDYVIDRADELFTLL